MTILQLFARIGLKTDQSKADQFQRSMHNIRGGLIAAAAAATAYSAAVQRMMRDSMATANELRQFTAQTGASADELQRWRMVADQAAGSGAAVATSIQAITKNQAAIRLGQGDISGFQLLGIDPRQDPFAILDQLRDRIGGLAPAMQSQVMEQIGVSRDLIQVLRMSREEFDALAEGAPVMSSHQIRVLNEAREVGHQVHQTFQALKNTIAAELAPGMVELMERFREFMIVNREGIIAGVQRGLDILVRFGEAVINAARMTDRVVRSTVGWSNALKGLAVAVAWFNRALLFSPIGMFMAAIVALILVMDDLSAYFDEDDPRESAFGNFMERFPQLEERLLGFMERFRELRDLLRALWSGDVEVWQGILDSWGKWGEFIRIVIAGIERLNELAAWGDPTGEGAATERGTRVPGAGEQMMAPEDVETTKEWLRSFFGRQSSLGGGDNRTISININGGDTTEVRRILRQELSHAGAQIGAG